jgi:hypothetical protein
MRQRQRPHSLSVPSLLRWTLIGDAERREVTNLEIADQRHGRRNWDYRKKFELYFDLPFLPGT